MRLSKEGVVSSIASDTRVVSVMGSGSWSGSGSGSGRETLSRYRLQLNKLLAQISV